MPEDEYRHIRIRNPKLFSKFRVIKHRSHLSEEDQKKVRAKIGRKKGLYTVGKFKKTHRKSAPKGKRGAPLSWGLQKIMVMKGGKKMGRKKKRKGKKWGKIGAPHSAKRKAHMRKIRKKR